MILQTKESREIVLEVRIMSKNKNNVKIIQYRPHTFIIRRHSGSTHDHTHRRYSSDSPKRLQSRSELRRGHDHDKRQNNDEKFIKQEKFDRETKGTSYEHTNCCVSYKIDVYFI